MLIHESSIFRHLPEKARKETLLLDGIRYSLEMSDFAYKFLKDIATDLSIRFFQQCFKTGDGGTAMVLFAWSIVDSVDRLRNMLRHTRTFNSKEPYIKTFLDKTNIVRELRNKIQHQPGKIDEYIKYDSTIIGVLGWVHLENTSSTRVLSFTFIPGTVFDAKEHSMVNPSGRQLQPPVDLLTLSVNEKVLCLSELFEELKILTQNLESALNLLFHGKPNSGSDALVVAEMDFSGKGKGDRFVAGDKLGIGVKTSGNS